MLLKIDTCSVWTFIEIVGIRDEEYFLNSFFVKII